MPVCLGGSNPVASGRPLRLPRAHHPRHPGPSTILPGGGIHRPAPTRRDTSDPTETELVETFWRPGRAQRAAFLYADGRLIWNEYFEEESTGWLEQSLTDDGIELVRALASELFLGQRQWILSPDELPGLLPDSAWADQEVRPYIPSGYAACLFVTEQENPFTESGMSQQEMLAAATVSLGPAPGPCTGSG